MKLELATLLAKDIPPFVIKWAKEWLMELGSDAQEQEDRCHDHSRNGSPMGWRLG